MMATWGTRRMMNVQFYTGALAFLAALATSSAPVAAQYVDMDDLEPRDVSSPRNFALELRVGPYQPQLGGAVFERSFENDSGPMLGVEFDVLLLDFKNLFTAGLGAGVGLARYSAGACDDATCQTRASEDTRLSLVPLTGLAVVRVDVLRRLNIPFILTGKVGIDRTLWSTSVGDEPSTTGWSTGLRMAAQIALDLNVFEPRSARNLDEEWGINHTLLFFELVHVENLGRTPQRGGGGGRLPVGDTTWVAGLGFIF